MEKLEKQKEEFDTTVLELQERITTLEHRKDDLEQYGAFEETADKAYEKVVDLLKVACPVVPVSCIDRAHRIGPEYKSYKNKQNFCNIVVCVTS